MKPNLTEKLEDGGTIQIYPDIWQIEYYFAGPDRRYNGRFSLLAGASIDEYIAAYRSSWDEYQRLRLLLPVTSSLEKVGARGLTIRLGSFPEGICFDGRYLVVRTEDELEKRIALLLHAKQRAAELQALLENL